MNLTDEVKSQVLQPTECFDQVFTLRLGGLNSEQQQNDDVILRVVPRMGGAAPHSFEHRGDLQNPRFLTLPSRKVGLQLVSAYNLCFKSN